MKKQTKDIGISAKDMGIKELRELADSLGLVNPGEKLGKKELLAKVEAFEEASIAEKNTTISEIVTNEDSATYYNDKKIISKTEIELNGKVYEDILVETGETFRNPIN